MSTLVSETREVGMGRPISQLYAQAPNEYRIAGPYAGLNFGLTEFDWEATPPPLIRLQVIGVSGTKVLGRAVPLDRLRSQQID